MNLINQDFKNQIRNQYLTENVSLFLYSLIQTCRPKNIIEFGTGYSTLFISQAINDIKNENPKFIEYLRDNDYSTNDYLSHTKFYNPKFTVVDNFSDESAIHETTDILKNNSLDDNITFVNQDIFDFIKTDNELYDFVWLDAGGAEEYMRITEHFLQKLPPNGIIIIHSTVGNLMGKLFVSELKMNHMGNHNIEIMTFEEPHKKIQNSFTVLKRQGHYKVYSVNA